MSNRITIKDVIREPYLANVVLDRVFIRIKAYITGRKVCKVCRTRIAVREFKWLNKEQKCNSCIDRAFL